MEGIMKKLLALGAVAFSLAFGACASTATQNSQIDSDLTTIRSGYVECVNEIGADSPQCKALSDGLHQLAEQIGSAQNTAGRIKAEQAGRRSMGY
jgi:hypothetical protein